jgi:hypothetical protein
MFHTSLQTIEKWSLRLRVIIVLISITTLLASQFGWAKPTAQAQGGDEQEFQVQQSTVTPRFPGPDDHLVTTLTPRQLRQLQQRHYARREALAARVVAEEGPSNDLDRSAASEETGEAFAAMAAGDLTVFSNNVNTLVPTAPQIRSTLGEPATVNMGKEVFYTGNTFAAFSRNEGVSWTQHDFPGALIQGETVCCDQDLELDRGRDRVFWGLLYLNADGTHGTVMIAVKPSPVTAPSCVYDLDFGANRLPDYPHLGLSNDFLYLSTNNFDTGGTAATGDDTWEGSQMWRFGLDEMAACQTVPSQTFTFGPPNFTSQRVFVPVEGATDSMYWGVLLNSTTFRLFEWKESANRVTGYSRRISASTFTNPDCRGGTNNTDWIQRDSAWSIAGFRMRGWYGLPPKGGTRDVIGFLWNVGADKSHRQGHIHGAVFDADTKNLVSQPHIWNADFCLAFPDTAPTSRGHPAVILAWGGKRGGDGNAVSNGILLGDDSVTGGGPFGDFVTVATGTHNPADSRYGDYLTIQQHEPCGLGMVAAGYVLSGGTDAANVQQNYIQFGRGRDQGCWYRWHNQPVNDQIR